MVDVSIGNETSREANWNRQTGRQTDKPVYWEAAPPKTIYARFLLANDRKLTGIRLHLFLSENICQISGAAHLRVQY